MKLILNIGLDVNATQTLAARVAYEIVVANGFFIHQHKVVQSDTEPTLVVEVTFDPFFTAKGASATVGQAVYRTAKELRQDCIAVYNPSKPFGALVGPHAAKWAPLQPRTVFPAGRYPPGTTRSESCLTDLSHLLQSTTCNC